MFYTIYQKNNIYSYFQAFTEQWHKRWHNIVWKIISRIFVCFDALLKLAQLLFGEIFFQTGIYWDPLVRKQGYTEFLSFAALTRRSQYSPVCAHSTISISLFEKISPWKATGLGSIKQQKTKILDQIFQTMLYYPIKYYILNNVKLKTMIDVFY